MEKITIQNFIDINEILSIIETESIKQNEGKIDPTVAYAINKNKKLFFDFVNKNKEFIINFPKFNKFVIEKSKLEEEVENLKNKKQNKKEFKKLEEEISKKEKELEELNKKYFKVIEINAKNLIKEEKFDKELYKFNIKKLPKLPQMIINYLIDNNLIVE